LFCGCTTTRYVPVETVLADTVWVNHTARDSIRVHDSIYVKEWQKGDTVYRDRDRWHVRYVEKMVRDTLYQSKVDEVQVPYPVEKELSWWQRQKLAFGEIALIVVAVLLSIVLFRHKIK
jgi:hypothetical protein